MLLMVVCFSWWYPARISHGDMLDMGISRGDMLLLGLRSGSRPWILEVVPLEATV